MEKVVTAYFRSPDDEWAHKHYLRKLHLIVLLRLDCMEKRPEGVTWFENPDWKDLAKEDELGRLPRDFQDLLRAGFQKFGFLVSHCV